MLLMLELVKERARTPMGARRPGGSADADADAAQGDAAVRGDAGRVRKRGAGGRPGPGSLQAVSEPAPSWDVSAVFAKS